MRHVAIVRSSACFGPNPRRSSSGALRASSARDVGAAAKAGRVVMVAGVVGGRRVAATLAVATARHVLVVAAVERAAGIGHPLVEVADHVVNTVAVGAAA